MANILVIDDSPTIVTTLQRLLGEAGHTVYTAQDGLAAFATLRNVKADLILLDIGLPGVGGIELCVAIRHMPTLAATPIVMVTGSHKHIDRMLAAEFGASAYITKPFQEDELLATVDQMLMSATAR